MRNTTWLMVVGLVAGAATSAFSADLEVKTQEKMGVNTDFGIGGVRIVSKLSEGYTAIGGGVQINAKVKAPVRNVKGLSAAVKVENESELQDDASLNGRYKVAVSPELEMKLNQVTVRGTTEVVRLVSTAVDSDENKTLLYTDYLRPSASVDYAPILGMSFGFKYRSGDIYDPDNVLTSNRAKQAELRRAVNEDHELETNVKYRDSKVGLGLALGYSFGKKVTDAEAPQTLAAKLTGDVRATNRVAVSGEVAVDTSHMKLENPSFAKLDALRYSFGVGMKAQVTAYMSLGAIAQASIHNKADGRSTTKQTLGVSTSLAI